MNILLLTHYETVGGRRQLEINTLRQAGHSVQVVAWNSSGKEYQYDFPVTYIHNRSRVYFSQSLLKKGLLATLWTIGGLYPRTLKMILATRWDVLHCCNLALLPLAVLGKWLKGGKIIFDSYEMPILKVPLRIKNRGLAAITRLVLENTERFLVSQVDGVLTIPAVGGHEKKKFARYCNNVEVLMNVPDLQGIVSHKDYPQPPTAIFFGGLNREKGLFAMLEAAALLVKPYPNFRLILIGYMFENPAAVQETIDRLGIRDHVVLHSWVPTDKLGEYLAHAWVGLWPSQPCGHYTQVTTGNSRKGFQYMKYGLPIVGTTFGEIATHVAEEGAGLLVDCTRPEALAAAMAEIFEHPELREKMSANGLAAVRTKYNWESESKKLLKVYRALEG
ncbi:MAG: glycosyltransferase [Deltaproteobacteria bacterium]|nr:MAG: glycosyltransferase [Deltaproteobacteria bacterium]